MCVFSYHFVRAVELVITGLYPVLIPYSTLLLATRRSCSYLVWPEQSDIEAIRQWSKTSKLAFTAAISLKQANRATTAGAEAKTRKQA